MFDLELLFAPTDTAPAYPPAAPAFRPAMAPEPEAEEPGPDPEDQKREEPERPFALPSPEELALLIEQHYDEVARYDLICALLKPAARQEAEPAALSEETLIGNQGRRKVVMLPDGFALLMVTAATVPAPLIEGERQFWFHHQAAAYLGCTKNHLQLMLSRSRADQPGAEGWRFVNENRTRCVERRKNSACWMVTEPPG